MAVYAVYLEQTLTEDITEIDLSLDYIANVGADSRVFVDGLLLTLNSDYTISNIVQYPYYTTFTINFLNTIVSGSVLRVEKNEEWNQWIAFKFPNLESRIADLESKVGTATDIESRISAVAALSASHSSDINDLKTADSNFDAEINQLQIDVTNLQNANVTNVLDIADLKAFMGIEGNISIDNNVLVDTLIPELTTDGYEYSSVKIDYEIMRRTGTEYRSSVGSMYLVCKDNGVWYTERGLQVIDLDGVTFNIVTDVNRIGSLYYTSDLMAGAGYLGYFKFRTTKFEV
jgi:hypothetical protein